MLNNFKFIKWSFFHQFILVLILLISCNSQHSNENPKGSVKSNELLEEIAVKAIVIQNKIFNKQIVSNGKIQTSYKSDLKFKLSDQISIVNFRNGQHVNKGETIAILENNFYKNQLEKAKIKLEKAKIDYLEERIKYGLGSDTTSDSTVNTLKNIAHRSGLLEAENEYQSALIVYEDTFLKSPFSGIIANLDAKKGSFSNISEIFCSVISNTELEVLFPILENDLGFIYSGQEVQIKPFFSESKTYFANLIEINPIVDSNGLITVKAKLIDEKIESLFHGMNVKIQINKPLSDDYIVIPKTALVQRDDETIVFSVTENKAVWNYVTIIDENSSEYAVQCDLKTGDTIIIEGNTNLSHGAKVITSP